MQYYIIPGPPSVPTLSSVDLSEDVEGAVNVTVSWTLSGGDSADFYLIKITTNAPQTPYGELLNITTASVTLTGFIAGYEYNITVRGVNCGGQEGRESEPLTITPQGTYTFNFKYLMRWSLSTVLALIYGAFPIIGTQDFNYLICSNSWNEWIFGKTDHSNRSNGQFLLSFIFSSKSFSLVLPTPYTRESSIRLDWGRSPSPSSRSVPE